MKKEIKEILNTTMDVYNKMINDENFISNVEKIANVMIEAYYNNKKILIAGNGGSAGDAQHFAGELVNRFYFDRDALSAIALTTDTSVLTCISNDSDFNNIFSRQIEANAFSGDIFLGISTSGNSKNIINAIKKSKEKGLITVGLTGIQKCTMDDLCDYVIKIPSNITPRIQEGHLVIEHILCYLIEKNLFKEVR